MNKLIMDPENGQKQTLSSVSVNQNMQKKARPKFTILDDIDQLNQIINGPGANQQSQKAQQVLQKTYQYMKGNETSTDTQLQANNPRIKNNPKDNVKNHQNKQIDQKQNKKDMLNLGKQGQTEKLHSQLKNIKGPRIIVSLKKLDLTKEPNSIDFYLQGLQNILTKDGNDGTRAPTNSMRQDQDGTLFTKALQKTQRLKNAQGNQLNSKQHRSDVQFKSKR